MKNSIGHDFTCFKRKSGFRSTPRNAWEYKNAFVRKNKISAIPREPPVRTTVFSLHTYRGVRTSGVIRTLNFSKAFSTWYHYSGHLLGLPWVSVISTERSSDLDRIPEDRLVLWWESMEIWKVIGWLSSTWGSLTGNFTLELELEFDCGAIQQTSSKRLKMWVISFKWKSCFCLYLSFWLLVA